MSAESQGYKRSRVVLLAGTLWRRGVPLAVWTPAAVAFAYLLAVLVQFGQILGATYLDADAASAPVIGQLYNVGHSQVVLGQMAWYSTLLYELATRWLPLHRQIWEASPYAMALVSAGLLGWGLWRMAGRWAAATGAALLICAAPHTLHLLFSLNDHSPTWFSLTLLASLLILLEHRGSAVRLVWGLPLVVVVGAIVGANMASDTLLIVAGIIPAILAVVATGFLMGARPGRRAAWLAAATVLVAIVADAATKLFMHHESVTVSSSAISTGLATMEAVSTNFKLWWQSIAVLGNGEFFGGKLGFTSGLQLLAAALSILSVVVLAPRTAWRELSVLRQERTREATPAQRLRLCWATFWGTSVILLSLGFMVSASPLDINSDRYLVGLIYGAAALVPLLGVSSKLWRATVAAGATVFALSGFVTNVQGVATRSPTPQGSPSDSSAAAVARIAREEHLKFGYAGYWDAAPITWATHFGVQVYPVQACGAELCRFGLHYIASWYTPLPGTRSFLIDDPTEPVRAPAVAVLGAPSAVYHVGVLTMYVYPYDIASRIQP